ncbi:MAG: hypothetical protein Q8M15_14520 [Bacteroidota bacterium]|nr:hypothetical protein [Bacteroidota bacterium]
MLTEIEKKVLEEYISEIKNTNPIINCSSFYHQLDYDLENGEWASFKLLKSNIEFVLTNGNFNSLELKVFKNLISKKYGQVKIVKSIDEINRDKIANDEQDYVLMDDGLKIVIDES